jgi:hypothetical protein
MEFMFNSKLGVVLALTYLVPLLYIIILTYTRASPQFLGSNFELFVITMPGSIAIESLKHSVSEQILRILFICSGLVNLTLLYYLGFLLSKLF